MRKDLQILLKKLRAYGVQNNIPNITDQVALFLSMLIRIKKPSLILEIGCANGYSTIWLAEAAEEVGARLHTIDHSAPTFEEARQNLGKAKLLQVVTFHFGDAVKIISQFDADLKFDFVFVDGEKASYLNFWQAIEGRLAAGAVIVFDDMMAFPEKTKPFSDFIVSAQGIDQLLIPIDADDGVLMIVKK
ncbi:class I SAM-dependent methyltransferase [Candidatus Peregrinibacteria bacterium]|nr:class I SAM-dependent methyltransferase [Candidatus Peregrinibacteria bacterium]